MHFIINTGHPNLSFSSCVLNIAQASFDLHDQIMAQRSQLLSLKTWHNHGEVKQLFECSNGDQLRELNQQFDLALEENHICAALVTDAKHHEPVCLALFGIASYLEQYTSQFKRLNMCPSRFFLQNNTDEQVQQQGASNEASAKQWCFPFIIYNRGFYMYVCVCVHTYLGNILFLSLSCVLYLLTVRFFFYIVWIRLDNICLWRMRRSAFFRGSRRVCEIRSESLPTIDIYINVSPLWLHTYSYSILWLVCCHAVQDRWNIYTHNSTLLI